MRRPSFLKKVKESRIIETKEQERGGKEKETKSNDRNEELERRKEERNGGRVSAKRKNGTGERDSRTEGRYAY